MIVAMRVGPSWTNSVAIEGEDRCVASHHPTCDDSERPAGPAVWHREGPGLVLGFPDSAGAVWSRDGRAEDVLAEQLAKMISDSVFREVPAIILRYLSPTPQHQWSPS